MRRSIPSGQAPYYTCNLLIYIFFNLMYSMGTRRFALEHIKVTHHISIYFCILSLISQSLFLWCMEAT